VRPRGARTTGAGCGQALIGAGDDEFADELGERGEDVENQAPARVVVSSASCRG
jgi:hypothetical protein